MVRKLLQIPGIDVNAETNDSTNPTNPIHNAVYRGNLELVELLANAGADLSYKGGRLESNLLFFAIYSGSIPILEYLIQKGVNIDEVDESGWTPIFLAAQLASIFDQFEALDALVRAGADVNKQSSDLESILFLSVMWGNGNLTTYLIDNGADVNLKTIRDFKPAYAAVVVN